MGAIMGRLPGRVLLMVWLLMGTGCGIGGAPPGSAPAPASTQAPSRVVEQPFGSVPEWRRGDRWVYEWASGSDRGTRTVEVLEPKTVNGVEYYVVEIGPTSEQYYTKDLHFAASVQASRVLARAVPPQPWFKWPLTAGTQWEYRGVYEERQGSKSQHDVFGIVGIEQVTVAAGTFRTFKVVRKSDGPDSDQYWYAPDVRWYVRWIGRRGDVEFDEQLKAYQPAPRVTSTPATR
jgi:hypothetical protein